MKDVEEQCLRINPKIKTRIVQADFAGNANIKFYENIYKQLEDLDIAMLINNAGVVYPGLFENVPYKDLKATLDVDLLQVSLMTSFFINKLLTRQ